MPKNKPAKKLPAKIAARWKKAGKKARAEEAVWAEIDRKKAEEKAAAKAAAKKKYEVSATTNDNSAVRSGDSRKEGVV